MSESTSNVHNPDRVLGFILLANASAAVIGSAASALFLEGRFGSVSSAAFVGALAPSILIWAAVAVIGIGHVVVDAFRLPEPTAGSTSDDTVSREAHDHNHHDHHHHDHSHDHVHTHRASPMSAGPVHVAWNDETETPQARRVGDVGSRRLPQSPRRRGEPGRSALEAELIGSGFGASSGVATKSEAQQESKTA